MTEQEEPAIRFLLEDERALAYLVQISAEIENAPPRMAAIIAGVVVDEGLREVIAKRLNDEPASTALLDKQPLGSYSSRYTFLKAIGLIGPKNHRTLQLIGELRNYFAHRGFASNAEGNIADLTFSDEWVAERCRQLWWPPPRNPQPLDASDYRRRFHIAAMNMAGRLWLWRFKGDNHHLEE